MSQKSDEQIGFDEAIMAIQRGIEILPPGARRSYLEMLGQAATKFMRAFGGDDYVRGWLEAATKELDEPPQFVLRRTN